MIVLCSVFTAFPRFTGACKKERERALYYKKYIWCKYSQINYTELKKEYIQNYQNSNNKKPKQSSTSYSKDPYKLQIIFPQKTKPNFFTTTTTTTTKKKPNHQTCQLQKKTN